MRDTASCPWDSLLPELRARIASSLPPNDVACVFRLINKLTSREFNGWICVRLSQPVPHHAFVRRWGDERGVHDLSLKQRQRLLCLTARSGVVANLEVAVAAVGCPLTDEVLSAAAEAGHLVACVWLLDMGCPRDADDVNLFAARGGHAAVVRWLVAWSPWLAGRALIAAAGAGERALCEELMATGDANPRSIRDAACKAAEGGHVELTEWLLGQLEEPGDMSDGELLRRAACGFELPELQRLFHSRLGSEASAEFREHYGSGLAAAALASPTPDWRAKLEWQEAVGCRLGQYQIWDGLTKRGDAVERVVLLRERGLLDAYSCLWNAIASTNLSVIRYLRSEGLLTGALADSRMSLVMEAGNLAVLTELLAAGGRIVQGEEHIAARNGHLHVLHWLEGPEAGPEAAAALQKALQNALLAVNGAKSGSLELMEWLWERGCPSDDERVFTAAAGAGNAAILERLAVRGCRKSAEAYLAAGRNGDLATLRCLRRLDCPWGPGCDTFNRAVYDYGPYCSLEVLRWLVAEGCPVDWGKARALQVWRGGANNGVTAWIQSHIPQA